MAKRSGDVVILGAGFSKAVNNAFPVLSQLAEQVLQLVENEQASSTQPLIEELRRVIDGPKATHVDEEQRGSVDFEGWLSRIAVDQPHLSLAENYERRALFARVTIAIRQVLLEAERQAFSGTNGIDGWPYQLLRLLDVGRATVITMNYDTIIERLAPLAIWPWYHLPSTWSPGGVYRLHPADLFGGLPPTVPTPPSEIVDPSGKGGTVLRRAPETLRLIKLHGSLDWFAAPTDPTGSTLVRWTPGPAPAEDDETLLGHPPGREPFLVPPDANKSPYFTNPVMRELWAQARTALERATRVSLVGYSLPATDTTFGGLLADTIGGRDVPVTVVDLRPDSVAQHLQSFGIFQVNEGKCSGEGAVEAWTNELVKEHAQATAKHLRDLATLPRAGEAIWYAELGVGPPSGNGMVPSRHVTGGRLVDGTFVLDLLPSGAKVPDGSPMAQLLPPAGATTVAADLADGRRLVISHYVNGPRSQHDTGWLFFLPTTAAAKGPW